MFKADNRCRCCAGLAALLAGIMGCALLASGGEVCDFTRQPIHLAYADWHDNVKQEGGATQIRANGRGGVLAATSLDLSADRNVVLALTLKIAEANQASSLQVRLVDAAGGQGVWDFPIAGLPKGKSVTVLAEENAPLGKPARGKGKLNLKKISQWHVQGSWLFNGTTAVDLLQLSTVAAADAPAVQPTGKPADVKPAGESIVVHDFTKKEGVIIGGFLAWEGHAAFKDGVSAVDAPSGAGGAYFVHEIDLGGHQQDTLALTLRARAGNAATQINIGLADVSKHNATWTFDLGKLKVGETARVVAKDTVSLVMGATGPLDLGNITAVNVTGNWSANPVALDLLKLETVPPTPDMDSGRAAAAEKAVQKALAELPPIRLLGHIQPMPRGEQSPDVTGICLVAPDVLAITIEAGKVTLGKVLDYVPQDGDDLSTTKDAQGIETVTLKRGGKAIGDILGAGAKRQVITPASFSGDPLQTELADHADCYTITSTEDPAYTAGLHPTAIHRKSKPIDWFGFGGKIPARHVVFLHLPKLLREGKSYRIDCGPLNIKTPVLTYRNNTRAARSLAVHTTQIGYRADDPFKRGYLSIWLGASPWTGASGALSYPAGLKFHLLDDASGKEVFSGAVEMAKAATDKEFMFKDMNFNGTDVLRMDFSDFGTPGRYRLYVEGIGCGYPFEIGPGTWDHAFWTQMRGFYHQRSGIPLGPPYTTFVKPRDHHPDDVPVFLSKYAETIWSGEKEPKLWDALKEMATDQRVTNGWGGYHDAGDWNPRRVTHMRATLAQLEIADLFPEYVAKVKLNIPQDYKVPDLFNEVLFEIDCFRRMQTPAGGVGYGLETAGDPAPRTVSWHTKVLPVYMLSPDAGNSWLYAATAARAARLLKRYDATLAAVYEDSARKAMSWAEADFARQCKEKGKTAADLKWAVRDSRNLAAIEMLRLTGDRHWHEVFMENTVLTNDNCTLYAHGKAIQSDAAFAYTIADEKLTDPIIRKRAVQGLERQAKVAIGYANGNAFDILSQDKWRPMFMGFYSTPLDGRVVLRAYHLTRKPEYLAAGIRACQFSSGANPENLVETTGLGSNPILHPLRVDPRMSGQPVPEGLTVYGIEDHVNFPSSFCYWILPALNAVMSPEYLKWPVTESYVDTYCFVMVNEFTTDIWDQSVWTWGYLAARP